MVMPCSLRPVVRGRGNVLAADGNVLAAAYVACASVDRSIDRSIDRETHVCGRVPRDSGPWKRPTAQSSSPIMVVVVSQVEGVTAAFACGVGCVF
jgi:hypothetical protein